MTIIALISTVPNLHLPRSLKDVQSKAKDLGRYSSSDPLAFFHVLAVLACLFCYKQAFSIPGSILINVLFGHLYSLIPATILTSSLTAVGSILAYALARLCEPLARNYLPKSIESLESRLPSQKSGLFSSLLLLRLFPLLPYAAVNIAAGVLKLPIVPFFWSLVLGSIPYNAVTTQVGELLSKSDEGVQSIWSASLAIKLFIISILASFPIIFQSKIKRFLSGGGGVEDVNESNTIRRREIWGWKRRKASVVEGFDKEDLEVPLIEIGSQVW